MPDWPPWVWILIAVIIALAIIAIIVGASRRSEVGRRKAAELRNRAATNEHLIGTRQERAQDLTARADSVHQQAATETERAEALREKAAVAEERAARATEQAEVMQGEAVQSQSELDKVRREHDGLLREADRLDPDAETGRDGHRAARRTETPDAARSEEPQHDAGAHAVRRDLPERDADEELRLSDQGRPMHDTSDVDDIPRDEQGRRLDPYGNPVD